MTETMRQAPDFVNYRPDRKTFAGLIYECEFDTEQRKPLPIGKGSYFAQKISTAQKFDYHCASNDRNRSMKEKYRNE